MAKNIIPQLLDYDDLLTLTTVIEARIHKIDEFLNNVEIIDHVQGKELVNYLNNDRQKMTALLQKLDQMKNEAVQ